jgi:hypothetical protein
METTFSWLNPNNTISIVTAVVTQIEETTVVIFLEDRSNDGMSAINGIDAAIKAFKEDRGDLLQSQQRWFIGNCERYGRDEPVDYAEYLEFGWRFMSRDDLVTLTGNSALPKMRY